MKYPKISEKIISPMKQKVVKYWLSNICIKNINIVSILRYLTLLTQLTFYMYLLCHKWESDRILLDKEKEVLNT